MFAAPESRGNGESAPDSLHAFRAQWSALVARAQRPIGVRLAIAPARAAGAAPPRAHVLAAVITGGAADAGAPVPRGRGVRAPPGVDLDDTLLAWSAPRNVLLEVGAEALDADGQIERLQHVLRNGTRLVLRAQSGHAFAPRMAGLFQYALAGADPRVSVLGGMGWLACDRSSRAEVECAFGAGAHAAVGWPLEEPVPEAPGALQPSQKTVLELVRLLQSDADTADLERAFEAEPVLAYLLLTLANSTAFRRGAPIGSLGQAIALLGTKRLLKWLILLLVIASKGSRALPQIHACVTRGFFIENLATALDVHVVADDGFATGAFSLLDRITGIPAHELLGSIDLPRPIVDAVLADAGPVAGYLRLARALEGADTGEPIAAPATAINAALLQALAASDALQSLV